MKKKARTHFICQECGAEAAQWAGKCFECGAWNSLVEFKEAKNSSNVASDKIRGIQNAQNLESFAKDSAHSRVLTGFPEVDRVLGGGLMWNSLLLLGGVPGIGKSTLLLQIAGKLGTSLKTLIISGEESGLQVADRAKRLKIDLASVNFISTNNLDEAIDVVNKENPQFVIVDSVQTLASPSLESSAGTVSQVREIAQKFMELTKGHERITVLVGHVTKEGTIAGPKLLEHMVDAVFYFENLNEGALRILRTQKNRFGSAFEAAVFEMQGEGLREVLNPSMEFLSERQENYPGTTVVPHVEGTRCFLFEAQALVQRCFHGFPRRTFQGIDQNRVALLLAVLEKHGFDFSNSDVYAKITSGGRVEEPAADLALAAALVSARINQTLPKDTIFIGELGLTGELRSVQHLDMRIQEAKRMGFKKFYVPQRATTTFEKDVIRIATLTQLKEKLWSKVRYESSSAELSQ